MSVDSVIFSVLQMRLSKGEGLVSVTQPVGVGKAGARARPWGSM